jgi:hypothetical protein
MDRRLVGVVVLVLALVAVSVIPSVTGRRIAGTAIPVTLPDLPQVGDCLLARSPSPADDYPGSEMTVDASAYGACDGVVAGEIVAVWESSDDPGYGTGPPWRDPCAREAAEYAGLERSGRSMDLPGAPSGPVSWRPTMGDGSLQLLPGREERSAGRDWVACLAVPTARAGYVGTLRDAYTTGSMPDEFGSCWDGTDLDQLPGVVRCAEPHLAELLATGWIRDRVEAPTAVIDSSCAEVAGRIMHTADPTRGGALKIVADRLTGDVSSRPDAPLSIACFVTSAGAQQLSGTLIGLADRPVPLVG